MGDTVLPMPDEGEIPAGQRVGSLRCPWVPKNGSGGHGAGEFGAQPLSCGPGQGGEAVEETRHRYVGSGHRAARPRGSRCRGSRHSAATGRVPAGGVGRGRGSRHRRSPSPASRRASALVDQSAGPGGRREEGSGVGEGVGERGGGGEGRGTGAGGGGVGCGACLGCPGGGGASSGRGSGASTGSGQAQGTPRSSQAYAVLSIPRLGLRVPVAEGVSKRDVLNKGYVGHYPHTQQAGQAGNFALAGHRNTHGEPFRYINRLRRGDEIDVETAAGRYVYVVDKTLAQTSANDGGVIREVPRSTVRPAYGYSAPGYYITLTTCTPEYTSRYRLVVWGTLTSMRPR
ncbi:class E sortase [Streptomyces sp. RLB1-33]